MGKGQSKSYDISSNPQKASHKRPKSSHQRESLLLNKDSPNINSDSQNNKPTVVVSNGDNSVTDKNQDKKGDNSIETKTEIKGIAENSNSNLESAEKPNNTEISEKLVDSENKEENQISENVESKSDDLKNEDINRISSVSNEYNQKEESDQIDKALEEYIEAQKKDENLEKAEVIPEETTSQEEVDKESDKVETEAVEVEKESDKVEIEAVEVEKEGDKVEIEAVEVAKENDKLEIEAVEVAKDSDQVETEAVEVESKEEVIQAEVELKEEVHTEDINSTAEHPPEDSEAKEPLIDTDDKEEATIDFEAEDETDQDTIEDIEEKPVEESDTVTFKTVVSLETTPPGIATSPQEADTREEGVEIVDLPPDSVPPQDPAVPIEEPTLPEAASVVSSEIPVDMSTVEAVVCDVDDLKDGEMREVDVGEGKVLLVREKGEYYAVGNKCTHYGAPLAKGALCNGRVRCPWHGACFNVKTGDIEDFPGLDSIPKYDVTVTDGKVKVKGEKSLLTSGKVQKPMCKQSSDNQQSVLVIGGGPASLMCAETLRKEGFTGKITIATQERHLPYDRIKLSKAMDSTADGIALRNEDFYKKNDIDIQKNKRATSVDRNDKTVTFEDGSSLSYTSLVIATGGRPRQLPIPGADFDNVCLLRTPDDANKIAEAAKGKKVVIIGSSFIGMEVAAFLADKAESLSVVDIIKVPFQLVLGEKVGSVLQKLHEDHGIKFHFEKGIKEFVGEDNKATTAVLSDDTEIPCDLVILGVGVVPATDFLKDSGINMTNRGFIPVTKHMKTNIDDIYAAGDIVEFPLFTAEDQQVNVQHWQMANAHGKAAALGILEKNEDIKSVPFFWTMMYSKSIRYTGYGFGYDDIIVHGDLDAPNFVAFYTKGEDVVAVATLGADPLAAQVAEIMYTGHKILKSEIQSSSDVIAEKFNKLKL